MTQKEAIKFILEYYNGLKDDLIIYERNDMPLIDYIKGQLGAIKYILIEVYEFKTNDNRF